MIAFFSPGPMELCIIVGIALLLFGSRLLSVARSIGLFHIAGVTPCV